MSQEIINIGAAANDGTGDPLRTAFDKVNNNFTQLYNTLTATGPDGAIQFKNTNTFYSTLYLNGTYIVAGAPGRIYTSDNGSIWNSANIGTDAAIYSLAYDGIDTIIAVGAAGTILRSNDGGITWTSSTTGVTENLYGAVGFNGSLAVVGANGTILTSHVGGEGYTRVPYVTIAAPANSGGIQATATASIANGRITGFTITNPGLGYDTVPTVTIANPYTTGQLATASANVSGGIVVAVDLTSGVSWSQPVTGITSTLTGITHGNLNISGNATPIYVATGVTGTVVTSTDLVTWGSVTTGTTQDLYSATIDPSISKLIVVGDNGTVLTSFDTSLWTTEISNVSTTLTNITFGTINTITDLIAVGNVGTVIRSNNGGVNWYTAAANSTTNPLLGVTFVPNTSNIANSSFLAVGSNATVIDSNISSLSNTWSSQSVGSALQGSADLLYFPGTQTLSANANIVPGTDSTYSLGAPDLKFTDLYLAGNSLYLGTTLITSNANNSITFSQASNTANLTTLYGNNITVQTANVYGNANVGGYVLANNITTYNGIFANANIPNLISNVANTNILNANTANIGNLTAANANITSLTGGNANLTGNVTANYFFGNGSFLTGIGSNTGNIGFTGNSIYSLGGVIVENADLSHGATAALILPINGNTTAPIQITNTYGNVVLQSGIDSDITAAWTFDNTGNLNLPANTFDVKYANGDPVTFGGQTGNVTFDDFVVQGRPGYGLGLAPTPDDTANLKYLQVRAGDVDSHIHFDTGNNLAYDQYFGDDNKFVKLNAGDFGNITVGTQNPGYSSRWTFDNIGNLTLPYNNSAINYANGASILTKIFNGNSSAAIDFPSGNLAVGINLQPVSGSWINSYGNIAANGTGDTDGSSVIVDEGGNIYVTGALQNVNFDAPQAYVRKLDSNGNVLWQKGLPEAVYGSAYSSGETLAIDGAGNLYWLVNLWGGTDTVLVAKLNSTTGESIWTTQLTGIVYGYDITVSGAGQVFVATNNNARITSLNTSGAVLWSFDPNNGGTSILDIGTVVLIGYNDGTVAAYNYSGNLLWTNQVFNNGQSIWGLAWDGTDWYAADENGNITKVSGADNSTILWQRHINQNGTGGSIFLTWIEYSDGYIYATGTGNNALPIVKIDASTGNLVWARSLEAANTGQWYWYGHHDISISSSHYLITGYAIPNDIGPNQQVLARLPINGDLAGSIVGPYVYVDVPALRVDTVSIAGTGYATPSQPSAVTPTHDYALNALVAPYPQVNIQSLFTTGPLWSFNNDGSTLFPNNTIASNGNLKLQPNVGVGGAYLDVFLTAGPDIHIASNSENLILGRDSGANVNLGVSGNTTIQADTGTPQLWNFGYDGNLTVPGNIMTTDHGYQFTSDISNVIIDGTNVYVETVDSVFGGPITGQVVISGVTGTTQANGTWWYEAVENNIFQLFTNATVATPVNGTGWGTYVSGGTAVAGTPANLSIVVNENSWTFGANGVTVFPTLTVDLHNGGNQTGQTLQFGDPNQQAFITGPAPATDVNAQRLIIQGQRGSGTGEGGDVYIWGGDSNVNGGDIKIYAGDADTAGLGGNIHIAGGRGTTDGGEITLIGGRSDSGVGAYVGLTGGFGSTTGGNVSLVGGYGALNGGPINITGGIGGNGLGSYGNVNINAGASTWLFDNTGNLNLPQGGTVYETNIPFGGLSGKTIALKPYGGINADQQLLVYPTAGQDFNHLHLTSGNLFNTELFLGNDDFYVKLANTGNIVINTNDSVGNTAQWIFDAQGTIVNSGNLTLQTPSGVPAAVTAITGSSGSWESNPTSNLATTGGTGSGLTVNVSQDGGYAGTIAVATPGSGYTNGDSITVVSGSSSATFTISVAPSSWIFDYAGNLTVPGNISYLGASPAPSINGFDNATFANNITSGNLILNNGIIQAGTSTIIDDGINSIALGLGAQMDVFSFPFSGGGVRGQLTITGDISTTQALGTWYYQSINTYTYKLYTDSTYATLVDSTTWTPYTGGGSVAITKNIPAVNMVLNTNGYLSTFTTDGQLQLPGNLSVAGNLNITGQSSFASNINMNGAWVGNIGYAVANTDAASKLYVDTAVSTGINYHQPVNAATTTTLATATGGTTAYNSPNGAGNGIGAYISTTGSFTTIDGVTINGSTSIRILVKDEANAAWNGVYNYTNATAITRTTDTDEYGPDSTQAISLNDYFFTQAGTVNKGTAFIVSAPTGTIVIGTSNIIFSIFSTSQVYTAGTGIDISGTVISANASQTQITAVGTLGSLNVTGNATVGNLIGPLANGTSNVNIPVTNGNVNISAVGNANILVVTGTGANITGTANVSGNANVGNLGTTTAIITTGNITTVNTGLVQNGNSNVAITANANITLTSRSNAVMVITGTGANITGTANISGNANVGNLGTNIANITTANVSTAIITTGNITTVNTGLVQNGNSNVAITANANITLTAVSNATMVITGTGANITGTANVSGNANVGNLGTTTAIITTGNITTVNTGLVQNGNSNVSITANANVNISAVGTANVLTVTATGVTVTGNITGVAGTATTSSTVASVGYQGIPQLSKAAAYTTVIGDAGKHIYVTSTATITIDSNANVAYPIGTSIMFIANTGATATIAINSDTLTLSGSGTTGSRTLAPFGMATAVKVTSTVWFISGNGLT